MAEIKLFEWTYFRFNTNITMFGYIVYFDLK